MNLRMELDTLDLQARGLVGDEWSEISRSRSGLDLPRSEESSNGPLQKIGQALGIHQADSNAASSAQTSTSLQSLPLYSDPTSSSQEVTNYSYKFFPDATASTTNLLNIGGHKTPSRGEGQRASIDTGSIIGPAAKAQAQIPRNKGYFAGTSLLSAFFSNPRTRAPFKPQKSNRGTSSWQLKQYAEATLGSGSLRKAVKLPEGEDKDEWLAVNGEKCYQNPLCIADKLIQLSTFTTRLTYSMAPSPNSAHRRVVQR